MRAVEAYTRCERNGVAVIMPLEGAMRQNCLLVNSTTYAIYEKVNTDCSVKDLCHWYRRWVREKGADISNSEADLELFRVLLLLRDNGLAGMTVQDLMRLLPEGKPLRGRAQILQPCSLQSTAEFLTRTVHGAAVMVYSQPSLEELGPDRFTMEALFRRHLDREEVCFVELDKTGRPSAATAFRGVREQPHTVLLAYTAVDHAHTPTGTDLTMARAHLDRVLPILRLITTAPVVRLQFPRGGLASATASAPIEEIAGQLGFHRSFQLPGRTRGEVVIGYDRSLD